MGRGNVYELETGVFVFFCLNIAASTTAQSNIPMYVNMESVLMIGLPLFAFLARITAAFE